MLVTGRVPATSAPDPGRDPLGQHAQDLARAPPTTSAASAAPRCPSRVAITRPVASAGVNISGGSRSPRPTR